MTTPTPAPGPAPRGTLTRTRLLDAAEELFADRGYHGASVRDITERACTRVAAVSDHFGGKDKLFREVLLRRLEPLNGDRRARLAALPEHGSRPERLGAIIDAFAHPMLLRAGESQGWCHYFRFTAQLANSGQAVQLLVATEYNTVAVEFIDQLRRLFPEAPDAAVHDAYLHMLASVLHVFAHNLRLDSITSGRLRAGDLDQRYTSLRTFLQGGITTLLTAR